MIPLNYSVCACYILGSVSINKATWLNMGMSYNNKRLSFFQGGKSKTVQSGPNIQTPPPNLGYLHGLCFVPLPGGVCALNWMSGCL